VLKGIYNKFWILIFALFSSWTFAQDYEKLGKEICENISKNYSISQKNIFKEFSKYYDLDNEKKDLLISDFNGFSFNLQKEIIKNCSNKLPFLDSYSLMPLSNIADIEKIFSSDQTKKLGTQLKEIQYKNRLQIIVVTTDDYFPNENIDEYSFSILNNNYDYFFENGGIILVINLKERNIRISTNLIAREKLSDEFCQDLIDKTIVPNFKNEKYFDGIEQVIQKIQNKIQE
jgi:uncharacterized protein